MKLIAAHYSCPIWGDTLINVYIVEKQKSGCHQVMSIQWSEIYTNLQDSNLEEFRKDSHHFYVMNSRI